MTALARHTKANRDFFVKGCAPHVSVWVDWIERGVIEGKIIDGWPWVDLNWFAVNRTMVAAERLEEGEITGMELLRRRKKA